MSWLVTGGAGYIGSHVVQAFLDAGITPVVIDDLSSGHADFVPKGVVFVQGTILDTDLVTRTLTENACEGVVHLAGFKYAGVSVSRPLHTYDQNVTGTVSLLRAMQSVGVHNYVFSSSASVYGTPDVDQVTEQTPTAPESPYGQTKLIGEWLAGDIAKVDPQWRYTNLRYFNVVGSGSDALYDTSPHNLFPIVFDALLAGRTPKIFGDDYPTPDGTCHVGDRPGHRCRFHSGDRGPATGRSCPDRRQRRRGGTRHRLEDALHPGRDGLLGLERSAGSPVLNSAVLDSAVLNSQF